jgi:cytochrome c oxidase cbb3-type subunit 3
MKVLGPGLVCALAILASGCQSQMADTRPSPAERIAFVAARQVDLLPGGPVKQTEIKNPYSGNVYAISEGRRLFVWYHCAGCHGGEGGGAIGPPLRDKFWIYGGASDNIFASIMQGRPNGMPSWGGRIPQYQVWELVSYLRALSGQTPMPRLGEEQSPPANSR